MRAVGQTFTADLTGAEEEYEYKLTLDEEPADTDIAICVEEPGVFYIDNVRIAEDSLIKNGSFNAGFSGYEPYVDAKASIPRKLMFAIQRDGSSDDDWTPYSGEKIVDLTEDYNTYEIVFQMTAETDPKAVLSISMGAVDGIQITEKHRICIDNVNLEKIDAPETSEQPIGENLLANSDFASGSEE